LDDTTCAFIVEPIQGEGGVNLPSPDYLLELRNLCHKRNVLLVFDEVQVGMGRTGALFAHQNFGIEPDIMTLAKGIANGLPMGAMLATEKVASAFGLGSHGSTFGGTPLVCSAALVVLRELIQGNVLEHCRAMGARLEEGLRKIMKPRDDVIEVRGMGLIWAMELNRDVQPVQEKAQAGGLLINRVQENILRFTPPLTVAASQVDAMLTILEGALDES
jgi:acetylornithine/succinyldiaminopimelate/putrescine aminotransferase